MKFLKLSLLAATCLSSTLSFADDFAQSSTVLNDLNRQNLLMQLNKTAEGTRLFPNNSTVYFDTAFTKGYQVVNFGLVTGWEITKTLRWGMSFQSPIYNKFPDSSTLQKQGTIRPNFGAYLRYSEDGITSLLSGVYQFSKNEYKPQNDLYVIEDDLKTHAFAFNFNTGYTFEIDDFSLTPNIGVTYTNITRKEFHDVNNIKFAEFKNTLTTLDIGLKSVYHYSRNLQIGLDLTGAFKIQSDDADLVTPNQVIQPEKNKFIPSADVNIVTKLSNYSNLKFSGGASKEQFKSVVGHVNMQYEYRF